MIGEEQVNLRCRYFDLAWIYGRIDSYLDQPYTNWAKLDA